MAQHSDPFPPELAHRAASPDMEARLTRVLEHHWDVDGTLARALSRRPATPDPTRPCSLREVAREAAALLTAGGTENDVGGYLRREEVAVLPPPADENEAVARRERRERTRGALWRTIRGIARSDDLPPEDGARFT